MTHIVPLYDPPGRGYAVDCVLYKNRPSTRRQQIMSDMARFWYQHLISKPDAMEAVEWAVEHGAVVQADSVEVMRDGFDENISIDRCVFFLLFEDDTTAVDWTMRFRGTF